MNVQEATAKALLVDLDALAAAQRAGDVLGANAVLMDAYNTDVRPLLAELRAEQGLDPDPMAAYARSGYAERDRRRARRRQPGRLGRVNPTTTKECQPHRRRPDRPLATGSAPTRATPTTPAATPRPRAPTTDPVTGEPVELLWVKGSGGDLGTLTAAGLAVLRLDRLRALRRRLPRRRARGRDGRRVRLLPARQGRRGAVDRHRHARAGRRSRTSTTCTPTPASRWRPRPTARS